MPAALSITYVSEFTAELDDLRARCFPDVYGDRTSQDEFDKRSWYLVARLDGACVGASRLTPGPRAVFASWSRGIIVDAPETTDLGRVVIAPEARDLKMSRLLIALSTACAWAHGADAVLGAVRAGRAMAALLDGLGFERLGGAVTLHEPNEYAMDVQPLRCASTLAATTAVRVAVGHETERLMHRGVRVVSCRDHPMKEACFGCCRS